MAQMERALLSTVSVEDYVHDTVQVVELNRVQGVGLDMSVAVPLDRDDQLRGTKPNQLEAVVPDVQGGRVSRCSISRHPLSRTAAE